MKPWKTSFFLLAWSLVLTALLWMTGLPFFLFLFLPLIPFLSGHTEIRRCPVCSWETLGSERFCPYDATPVENVEFHQK